MCTVRYASRTLYIHYTYTIHTLFIHYAYTMHTLCIHYAYTIHTLYIHYTTHYICHASLYTSDTYSLHISYLKTAPIDESSAPTASPPACAPHHLHIRTDAGPRKRITLLLINLQFKIFFRINSLQLCKTLTRAVETKGFPPLESFSMAQQVTFSYYRGRLHIFSEEYVCEGGCMRGAVYARGGVCENYCCEGFCM